MSSLNVVPTATAGFVFTPNTFTTTGPFSGVNTYAPGQGCGQFRFDFWGEQLEVRMISGAGANPLTMQIDGGALTTPTITNGVMGYYNLATGLSLGWHTAVVRTNATATSLHFSQTDGFRVTASDNNPQVRLSVGYKTYVGLGATGLLSDGKYDLTSQFGFTLSQRVGGGFRADRFRAKTDKLPVYFVVGGTSYVQVRVDDVIVGSGAISNPATGGGYSDFVDLASLLSLTLDASTFHQYEVEWSTISPTTYAYAMGYALSLASGAQDTTATYTARPRDAYVGDSIVAGYLLTTPFLSWPYLASRARGGIAVTSSLSASQEAVDGPTLATALSTWAPYAYVWNEYGTNDMSTAGTSSPTSAWSTADILTLNNILTAAPTAQVMRLGILPRSSYNAAIRGNWNGVGTYGAQYNIAAATTPSRITYIDPLLAGLVDPTDYSEVGPTERLHPNASGNAKLAVLAISSMDPASGNPSPDFAVEVAFTSGYTTPAASRTWTDVTSYVEANDLIDISRGRRDQFSSADPSRLSLTLDNTDGRFTPENAAGAYYPNVKKGRPIRVRVRWPATIGAWTERFTGYVHEWPVEWPDSSTATSQARITAVSRQNRLGLSGTLRSIVEEEDLADLPVLYWPLGEPEGSTTAGNIAPGRSDQLVATQVGTGGTLTFGTGIGPETDGLAAPTWVAGASDTNGLLLGATLAQPIVGFAVIELECWFNPAAVSGTKDIPLVTLMRTAGDATSALRLTIATSGTVQVKYGGIALSDVILSQNSVTSLVPGTTYYAALKAVISGGNLTLTLIVNSGVTTSTTLPLANFPAYGYLAVGGLPYYDALASPGLKAFAGTVAHVAVYAHASPAITDARFAAHYAAGLTGFAGESSDARIARYARLAGIPTAEVNVAETGLSTSIAHKDTTGQTPVSLMQDVATTEDGVVFDGKDGTVTFHSRSHRYAATSAFTLDVAAGDVEGGLMPRLDDQNLTNDMTASRPDGVTIRSTNDASIAEYGYYRETLEVLTTSDNEVQSRADWEVNRFGTPRVTIPNLGVDLLTCSSALITALLAADVGTKFTVVNLPSQAPASTMEFFIEGYTEKIGVESYSLELNVSAAAYANVWTLDSSTLSQLDTTSVLAY